MVGKKEKGPVGPAKTEAEKEEDKLETFFCKIYEFHNPVPVAPVFTPAELRLATPSVLYLLLFLFLHPTSHLLVILSSLLFRLLIFLSFLLLTSSFPIPSPHLLLLVLRQLSYVL